MQPSNHPSQPARGALLCLALALSGCATHYRLVRVPPRITAPAPDAPAADFPRGTPAADFRPSVELRPRFSFFYFSPH